MKRPSAQEIKKVWLTPGLVVTVGIAILGGLWGLSRQVTTHVVEAKQVQFESIEQRVKVVEWAESDYNQVAVYEEGKKVSRSLRKIDTIFKQNIRNDSLKKIKEKEIELSRASRDSSQKVQAKAMKSMDSTNVVQTQTLQKILKLLDTTQ